MEDNKDTILPSIEQPTVYCLLVSRNIINKEKKIIDKSIPFLSGHVTLRLPFTTYILY